MIKHRKPRPMPFRPPVGPTDGPWTLGEACASMHLRLVDWGLWMRGGGSGQQAPIREFIVLDHDGAARLEVKGYREPDPNAMKPRVWSGAEVRKIELLNYRVIRLPRVHHRIVLQAFYLESSAEHWETVTPDERENIIRDLTLWPDHPPGVNARIRDYNESNAAAEHEIRPADFMPILHRAVQILCNNERMLP